MGTTVHKSKKVCLLGDGAVGKTSLIRRYVLDTFDDKYITTIGTKVSKKVLKYPDSPDSPGTELTLMIWDIIGQRGLPQLHSMYFKGASAGFLVCDMTRRATFDAVDSWRKEFFATVGRVPLIILVNKADLKAQAQITKEDIERKARAIGATYFLTSAKTGMNVQKAFFALGKTQVSKTAAAGPENAPGGADLTFAPRPAATPERKEHPRPEERGGMRGTRDSPAENAPPRQKEKAHDGHKSPPAEGKTARTADKACGEEKDGPRDQRAVKKKKRKPRDEDDEDLDFDGFNDLDGSGGDDKIEEWG